MNTESTIQTLTPSSQALIAEEAAYWLVTLRVSTFGEDDPYRDAATRNAAFFEWVRRSPRHLVLYMEFVELEYRFERLSDTQKAEIRESLEKGDPRNDQSS